MPTKRVSRKLTAREIKIGKATGGVPKRVKRKKKKKAKRRTY